MPVPYNFYYPVSVHNVRPSIVISSVSSFLLRFALDTYFVLLFEFLPFSFPTSSVKMSLEFEIALAIQSIFTIPTLPIHEHDRSFCLLVPSISFKTF